MSMTKTGAPLDLSAPVAGDVPGWVADFAGNARKTNEFAKETNEKIGDKSTLKTENNESLVAAINEVAEKLNNFEAGTNEDIDNIIGGTYIETAEPGGEPENIGTQEEIKDIVDSTFQN